jgi:hypothetical protein
MGGYTNDTGTFVSGTLGATTNTHASIIKTE